MSDPHAAETPDPQRTTLPRTTAEQIERAAAEGTPPPPPEPTDWSAEVMRLAERLRPARDAAAAERAERDRERDRERTERTRNANRERSAAQVPVRYRDAVADHPAVRAWVEAACAGSTDGLILNGPVGVGKTWQAYGAWSEVAQRTGCSAVAIAVPDLLDALRPGRPGTVDYDGVEGCRLLLLDDLTAERATDWTGEVLYRLIDARWRHMRPTVVTCNAPGRRLREQLGDRVASRLNGLGRYVDWPADAPDRRRRVDTVPPVS